MPEYTSQKINFPDYNCDHIMYIPTTKTCTDKFCWQNPEFNDFI